MWIDDLRKGMFAAFESNEAVHLLGEDVLDPYGGAFKVTAGLSSRFPDRVHTTPIAEAGIVGVGVGMAMRGLRPIVELMFGDFLTLAVDQLVNHAAKFTTMYGRVMPVPLVVRTPVGGGRGYGPTHSQTLEKLVLGVPGLKVIAPSVFHDPGIELQRAVADDVPVIFVEHKLLYAVNTLAYGDETLNVQPGADENCLIVRNFTNGAPDVSVTCYGGVSLIVADAMRRLAPEEIKVEACIPADVSKIPDATIAASVSRSGHLLVVDEGMPGFGWASEVAADIGRVSWGNLRAPVRILSADAAIIAADRSLEDEVLPSPAKVERELLDLLA